ncbi:MAG: hypothetical protein ABJ215_12120 [Alphaproteobacteria bacterium]
MAMFRYIARLAGSTSSTQTTDGPSRVAVLSAAGITFLVTIFVFSA